MIIIFFFVLLLKLSLSVSCVEVKSASRGRKSAKDMDGSEPCVQVCLRGPSPHFMPAI